MEIFIKETGSKTNFKFPMLPESISVEESSRFTSYDIMKIGEVKMPSLQQLTKFSWQGKLPGKARKKMPFVNVWVSPQTIQKKWMNWKAKGQKLLLTITDTPIKQNVYLENFNITYNGGFGDYDYTITFVQAKDIIVEVEKKTIVNTNTSKKRPSKESESKNQKTYTVKKGDSLWLIAQKCMGAGSKYPALYNANKSLIDGRNKKTGLSKYTIYAGQVLKIPS